MKSRDKYLAFGVPDFTEAEIDAVARVMRSGWIGMGPETLAFEAELAAYVGAPHVVTVNSCTSALFLSLLVEGIGAGDEVIVPSLTWCATANAALYRGATPVLCDVDPLTFCASPESVLEHITERTRAVIVVHYGGLAADTKRLRAALPAGVSLIEDAAHALGACYPDGSAVGSAGNLTCFSFYANKNVSTAEGGAIALFDDRKADHLRRLRLNGMSSNAWSRYIVPANALTRGIDELGYKMNYTDLQAAIGRVQLRRLEEMAAVRAQLVGRYEEGIEALGIPVTLQAGVRNPHHARHLLVGLFDPRVISMRRNDLLLALRDRQVGASVHYTPLHTQPLYRDYAISPLPVTDELAEQMMTLPISAAMSIADVDYVLEAIFEVLREGGWA